MRCGGPGRERTEVLTHPTSLLPLLTCDLGLQTAQVAALVLILAVVGGTAVLRRRGRPVLPTSRHT